MVRGLHFVDPGKNAGIPDDVMGNVGTILDGEIIADIAGDDGAVPDPRGDTKIVVFEQYVPEDPQADQAEEVRISDQRWLKGIGDKKIIPVGTKIFVFRQYFYFMGPEIPPGPAVFPGFRGSRHF
jgi:hypothetical protein